MTDLPTEVPQLQARLTTAREEYRKLARRVATAESRACQAETALAAISRVLMCDAGPAEGESNQLVLDAWEMVGVAGSAATQRYKAERRLAMIRRVVTMLGSLPVPLESQCEGIGWRKDAVSILAELRSEIELESA